MRASIVLFAAIAFALLGCASETLESEYDTYELATKSGAFQRGWFPTWLPATSTRLRERHNMDTNSRMWVAEVPVGTEIALPSECVATNPASLPKQPFERAWWPRGVPPQASLEEPFIFFKCKGQFIALAAAGGLIAGWQSN